MRKAVWLVLVAIVCCCFFQVDFLDWESSAAAEQMALATEDMLTPVESIWLRGEVREYLFQMAGQKVGRQWNQLLVGTETDSGLNYELRFKLYLDLSPIGQPTEMDMEGGLVLTERGQPLSYELNVSIDEETQKLKATFAEDKVKATVTIGDHESEHSVPYTSGAFVVDNNMIGQWGLMLGLLLALALEWARAEVVQTPQQVEQWLELPVMGSIPARQRTSGTRLTRALGARLASLRPK